MYGQTMPGMGLYGGGMGGGMYGGGVSRLLSLYIFSCISNRFAKLIGIWTFLGGYIELVWISILASD